MSPTSERGLTLREQQRLHEAGDQYLAAATQVGPQAHAPNLETFLPAAGDSLRVTALQYLMGLDLQFAWRTGRRKYLEDYVVEFPELESCEQLPAKLVFQEFQARRQTGIQPVLSDYRRRFPRQFDEFERMLREAAALQATATDDVPRPNTGTVGQSASALAASALAETQISGPQESLVPPRPEPPASRPSGSQSSGSQPSGSQPSEASRPNAGSRPDGSRRSESNRVGSHGSGQIAETQNLPEPDAEDSELGTVFRAHEGYRKIKPLGRGNFGEVWLAEAPGGVNVAMKIISWPLQHKLTQTELRALDLIKRMRHTFLLTVHAYWVRRDQVVIIMDLADSSLDGRLKQCVRAGLPGIPVDELIVYLRESAEALDYLHTQEVLHRDIKPENILLVAGHARIADFGLARVLGKDQFDTRATSVGTPLYMPPEVWQKQVCSQSDQYSLAATYFELRCNRPVFTSNDLIGVMRDHLEQTPDLSPLSGNEEQVLQRALAKDPKARFDTCLDFAKALELAVRKDLGLDTTTTEVVMVENPLNRRAMFVLLGVAGAGVTLAAAAGVWVLNAEPAAVFRLIAPARMTVAAGSESTIVVSVEAVPAGGKVELTFPQLPPGVTVQQTSTAKGEQNFKLQAQMRVDLNSQPGKHAFEIVARAGSETSKQKLELQIDPPKVTMPARTAPAPATKLVALGGKNYYETLLLTPPGGETVPLVLVPQRRPEDPGTFYMMETKVWNQLFSTFVAAVPNGVDNDDWKLGARTTAGDLTSTDHPRWPVFRVKVGAAHRFAVWLGGLLPTTQQWDKAAGRFDHTPEVLGPYLPSWKEGDTDALAVARPKAGPVDVGSAGADLSPLGVRDMAGNGREWTRNLYGSAQLVPLAEDGQFDPVTLRGRGYDAAGPLLYTDLTDLTERNIESQLYAEGHPTTSFRVVFEL